MAADRRGEQSAPRTVCVKKVAVNVTTDDLEQLFSDIGPVRKCFLVKPTGEQQHRGIAFVTFGQPDDANRAVSSLDGHELQGQRLKVEIAQKRAPFEERVKRKHERMGKAWDEEGGPEHEEGEERQTSRKATTSRAAAVSKLRLVRAVAIGNLDAQSKETALELCHQLGQVEEVLDPVDEAVMRQCHLRADGCSDDAVLVVFKEGKSAVKAVQKLHGQVLAEAEAGGKPAQRKRKRAGKAEGPAGGDSTAEEGRKVWARQASGEGALVKRWRVILRNLPFKATEDDVRQLLADAGLVWSVTLPTKPDGSSRGFGFATFTSRGHAQRAIAIGNGKSIHGRVVVVDWSLAKQDFQKAAESQPAAADDGAADTGDAQEAHDGRQVSEGGEDAEAHGDAGEAEQAEEEDGNDEEGMLRERSKMQNVLDQFLMSEEGKVEEDPEGAEPASAPQAKAAKRVASNGISRPKRPREHEERPASTSAAGSRGDDGKEASMERTVFVRSLPLDATSSTLQMTMSRFGTVASCRIVMDKISGRPAGTAFVEFTEPAAARKAEEAAKKSAGGKGPPVAVLGCPVLVKLALSQDAARKLAQDHAREGRADKRNLWLRDEGHVAEGSEAWEAMSESDRGKRKRALEERNRKLKSPNFHMSTTRLAIRNLPPAMDEKQLKRLLLDAVKQHATKARPFIKQVKVLRDESKTNESGRARSRGLAYAEFEEHVHALAALRRLNNNPDAFSRDRRPIVEFAVEDMKKVKLHEARVARARQASGAALKDKDAVTGAEASGVAAAVPTAADIRKSRAIRKRERRRLKRAEKRSKEGGREGGVVATDNGTKADGADQTTKLQARKAKMATLNHATGGSAEVVRKSATSGATRSSLPSAGPKKRSKAAGGPNKPADKPEKAPHQLSKDVEQSASQTKHDPNKPRKAASTAIQGGGVKKRQKKEVSDALDNMIADYTKKYFGVKAASKGTPAAKRGLKRWFD